jgi:hypothetical protein
VQIGFNGSGRMGTQRAAEDIVVARDRYLPYRASKLLSEALP